MITPESVSPFFKELYDTKLRNLKENLVRLDQLLSRHNFTTARRFCIYAIQKRNGARSCSRPTWMSMRMARIPTGCRRGSRSSANFKPVTSYRWPKKSQIPNPYLGPAEEKIEALRSASSRVKTTAPERKRN